MCTLVSLLALTSVGALVAEESCNLDVDAQLLQVRTTDSAHAASPTVVNWLQDTTWGITASNGNNVECILSNSETTENKWCWHGGNGGNAGQGQHIDFDFNAEKTISGIKFQCPQYQGSNGVCPRRLHVYYRHSPADDWVCAVDEGCAWSDVGVAVAEPPPGGPYSAQEFTWGPKTARYWRWKADGNYQGWVPALWMLAWGEGLAASTATAVGDPHLRNLQGHSFDIHRAGTYDLLRVPRVADEMPTSLRVQARVEPFGGPCGSMFITELLMAGKWLGDVSKIALAARQSSDPTSVGATGLAVGDAANLTVHEFLAKLPAHVVSVQQLPGSGAASLPTKANQHATTMSMKFSVGPGVSMRVSWVMEKTKTSSQLAHALWLSVGGLDGVKDTIGGLLGADDLRQAAVAAPGCKSSLFVGFD